MILYISLSEQDIDKLRSGDEVKVIPPQNCTYDNCQGVIMLSEEAFNKKFQKGEKDND
jgi:hypothetical protein